MIRKTFALVGIAGLALTGCAGQTEAPAEAQAEVVSFTTDQGWEARVPAGTMDACTYDDGTGAPCVWNAEARGNKEGTSFVVLESYDGPFAELTHAEADLLMK